MRLGLSILLMFGFVQIANAKKLTLMSYNVENLFDTAHDKGKEDYTYLPLSFKKQSAEVQSYCNSLEVESWKKDCLELDWNDAVLKSKILNLAKVITSYNWGRGADIVVMQEVENKNALEQLVNIGLKGKGYKYLSLLEGPDIRGIDVGVISKYPIVAEKLHQIDLSGISKDTRGILEVTIKVGNKLVTVFGNHWPSQGNPPEARVEASKALLEAADSAKTDLVVAAGDFNTLDGESPNGLELNIEPNFYNARSEALGLGRSVFLGSHWYKLEWSTLDKIYVLKQKGTISPKFKSFKVHKKRWMFETKKWIDDETGEVSYHQVPKRFNIEKKTGYADHFPVVMKFKL